MIGVQHRLRWLVLVLALVMSGLLIAACGEAQQPAAAEVGTVVKTDQGQYRDISAAELKAMMDKKDFFLVDVHVPNEGKLPELDARIPYDKITEELSQLPQEKSAKIVLTCKSGGMSTQASKDLVAAGYTNVYNLAGGFNAWRDAGYPFTPEP